MNCPLQQENSYCLNVLSSVRKSAVGAFNITM
jgi:hypothetical protein